MVALTEDRIARYVGVKDRNTVYRLVKELEAEGRPFNAFFFVDNKNSNNDTYMHVDQLAEMVSLALVTSAGELSTAAASVSDNLEKNIREGSMNIENKKAWVAGLGVCEIMYHGEDLKELYASKAVQHVVERLLNGSCVDTNTIVNAWIDSENVNIRENNGYDNVINFLLSKQPPYPFTSIDDKSMSIVKEVVGQWGEENNANDRFGLNDNILFMAGVLRGNK